MKKIILSVLLFILLTSNNICYAETVKYKDWRTDEFLYYDVNNYNQLYSVFEDLDYDYSDLMEEYESLKRNYNDLESELEKTKSDLDYLRQENKKSIGTTDDLTNLFKSILIIIVFPYLIYKLFDYLNKKKDKKKDESDKEDK